MAKADQQGPKGKSHKSHRKVFDVVPPGKSPASPNSRSVIVGHKPQVQDDQFVPEHTSHWAGDPSEKRPMMSSHKRIELGAGDGNTTTAPTLPKSGSSDQGKSAGTTAKSDKNAPTPDIDTKDKLEVQVGAAANSADGDAPIASSVPASSLSPSSLHPASSPGISTAPPLSAATHHHSPDLATSEHLADLAIEQVIDTDTFEQLEAASTTQPSSSASGPDATKKGQGDGTAAVPSAAAPESGAPDGRSDEQSRERPLDEQSLKTGDDIIAETGAPYLAAQKAVVSTHHNHGGIGRFLLILLLILIITAATLNFLLDAEIIETGRDVPYTDLIKG